MNKENKKITIIEQKHIIVSPELFWKLQEARTKLKYVKMGDFVEEMLKLLLKEKDIKLDN